MTESGLFGMIVIPNGRFLVFDIQEEFEVLYWLEQKQKYYYAIKKHSRPTMIKTLLKNLL